MYIFLLFFYSLDYLHSLVSVEEYSATFFLPGIAMAIPYMQSHPSALPCFSPGLGLSLRPWVLLGRMLSIHGDSPVPRLWAMLLPPSCRGHINWWRGFLSQGALPSSLSLGLPPPLPHTQCVTSQDSGWEEFSPLTTSLLSHYFLGCDIPIRLHLPQKS